jgi:DNA-directed RNA polymerase specialized sigma24 family protein
MGNPILNELSKDKELISVCKGIAGGSYLWEDLYQDTFLILFEKPKEVIDEADRNGKLKALAIKIMLNQWSKLGELSRRTQHVQFVSKWSKKNDMTQRTRDIEYITNMTSIPYFTSESTTPSTTANIKYWEKVIKDNNYNITEINPRSIKTLLVMEQMRVEDNKVGTGCPYRTIIFNYYLELGSVRAVADYTGINFMSIQRTIKEVKQIIRTK